MNFPIPVVRRITIPVTELQPGDRFVADGYHHYTVQSITPYAGSDEKDVHAVDVDVQFADGGYGTRCFDADQTLTIERPVAA